MRITDKKNNINISSDPEQRGHHNSPTLKFFDKIREATSEPARSKTFQMERMISSLFLTESDSPNPFYSVSSRTDSADGCVIEKGIENHN